MKYLLGLAFVLITLLIGLYIWGWQYDPAKDQIRLHSTGFNDHFPNKHFTSYSAYIDFYKELITQARVLAETDSDSRTVGYNAPREWLPDNKCKKTENGKYVNGILLIHGFTGSPYIFSALGDFLKSQCFIVRTLLLPGHGTVPGDLLKVTYQDWVKAVDYGIETLTKDVENIYIGGMSLGGLLAINAVVHHPKQFKAALLFAPLLEFENKNAKFIPILYGLSLALPRLEWIDLHEDTAPDFYESMPINTVYQIQLLLSRVKHKLNQTHLPVFILQSKQDSTVLSSATLKFLEKNTNADSKLLWFTNQPSQTDSTDTRVMVVNTAIPQQDILSFSHVSLLLPKTDPIHGMKGSYRYCLQYEEYSYDWRICKQSDDVPWRELVIIDKKQAIYQRTLFNFYFDNTTEQLGLFLQKVR